MNVVGNFAMSSYQNIYSLRKNPAIPEREHKANWILVQCLAFGLVLGLISRAAWDYGIITHFALTISDLGTAIWIMLGDMATVCWDFVQYVFR